MADNSAPPTSADPDVEDVTSYEAPDLSRLTDEQKELFGKLTAPFRPDEIEILPKPYKGADNGDCRVCGGFHGLPAAHLSYVGHAGITMRLIEVDPAWSWEPLHPDIDERALAAALQNVAGAEQLQAALDWLARHSPPRIENGGFWIRLHVAGMTAVGFGDADGRTGSPSDVKVMIGDAIRNAAMRLGVGTYLWSKSDKAKAMLARHGSDDAEREEVPPSKPADRSRGRNGSPQAEGQSWKTKDLGDEMRHRLGDLIRSDDEETLKAGFYDVQKMHDAGDARLVIPGKDIAKDEAEMLGMSGPLTLLEVVARISRHYREEACSVRDHIRLDASGDDDPTPMGSGDAEAARDAADTVRRPDGDTVQELRKAARRQNGGQQG